MGGGLHYYPAECVVAVAEVKSAVKDRSTLADALEKIASVKRLQRFAGRKKFDASIHGAHGQIEQPVGTGRALPAPYRTFGFVFTSDSMTKDTVLAELGEYMSTNELAVWPNM